MDFTKTENYLKEKYRICKKTKCSECPLSSYNNGKNIPCDNFQTTHTKKAIEIVQKWSDEHPPQKTILSDFLEKYPNALLNDDGIPEKICPSDLGLEDSYGKYICTDCSYCWNQPLQESENNR